MKPAERPRKIFLFDIGCREVQWMKSMEMMVGPGNSVQSSIYKQTNKKIGFNELKNSSWVVGSNNSE